MTGLTSSKHPRLAKQVAKRGGETDVVAGRLGAGVRPSGGHAESSGPRDGQPLDAHNGRRRGQRGGEGQGGQSDPQRLVTRNGDGSFNVMGHLEDKEKQKVRKYKELCDAENLAFVPAVTSTWGGFGRRSMEVVVVLAEALMNQELITKTRATKLVKRALQTATMVQVALNGMRFLEETREANNAAAVAAHRGEGREGQLQNPYGLGLPGVQQMPVATVVWPHGGAPPPATPPAVPAGAGRGASLAKAPGSKGLGRTAAKSGGAPAAVGRGASGVPPPPPAPPAPPAATTSTGAPAGSVGQGL